MRAIFALAIKDLRLMVRVRARLFFTLVWPLLVAVMFGLIFGGGGPRAARLSIAIADEDRSAESKAFAAELAARPGIVAVQSTREDALDQVRRGRQTAAVILTPGFGEARGRMFYGTPPRVELAIDPSRQAEAAMLEGLLFEQGARALQEMLSNPARSAEMVRQARAALGPAAAAGAAGSAGPLQATSRFLGEVERFMATRQAPSSQAAATDDGGQWQPLQVVKHDVTREQRGQPRSGFDITFVQGMIWGLIGCVMTFAVGLVAERTRGTFVRLQMAPITSAHVLGGKALACFVALCVVQGLLLTIGLLFFGLRVDSPGLFAFAMVSASAAFVGVMMLVASLGRTEEAASGAGWAILMPMAMLGGAMIPLIAMPAWMVTASNASPIKWAVIALEGAVWRGFGPTDMLLPCGILLALGLITFGIGVRALRA